MVRWCQVEGSATDVEPAGPDVVLNQEAVLCGDADLGLTAQVGPQDPPTLRQCLRGPGPEAFGLVLGPHDIPHNLGGRGRTGVGVLPRHVTDRWSTPRNTITVASCRHLDPQDVGRLEVLEPDPAHPAAGIDSHDPPSEAVPTGRNDDCRIKPQAGQTGVQSPDLAYLSLHCRPYL